MNVSSDKLMGWAMVIAIILLAGSLTYSTVQDSGRTTAAEARAEKMEAKLRELEEAQNERVWVNLDRAAQALETELEAPKHKELVKRLKDELSKVRGHYRFEQLGRER